MEISPKQEELRKEESDWFGEIFSKEKPISKHNARNKRLRQKSRDKKLYYLFIRDMGICQLCKRPVKFKNISIDHITAKNNGGCNEYWNLQISHEFCNNIKGDIYDKLDPEYFLNHPNYGYKNN